jgi:hypothetical protein
MKQPDYDDDYPTCVFTKSTLRIFSEKTSPAEITKILKLKPTSSFQKGESFSKGRLFRKTNGWFLETKESVKSKDTRRHIDFILQAIGRKHGAIKLLRQRGCKLDIVSYFESCGQGGPALWPYQMLKLGKLGMEIWWDIYFHGESSKTS